MKQNNPWVWYTRWVTGIALGSLVGCAAPAARMAADRLTGTESVAADTARSVSPSAEGLGQAASERSGPPSVALDALLPPKVKVFTFSTLNRQEFARVLQTLGITWDSIEEIQSRVFYTFHTEEMADRAVQLWKVLDAPPKDIQLRFELLRARPGALMKAEEAQERLPGYHLGSEIIGPSGETLLGQLQHLFNEYAFQVLSTSTVVAQSGNQGNYLDLVLEGVPTRDPSDLPAREQFMVSVRPAYLPEGGVIRLEGLEVKRVLVHTGEDPSAANDQDFLDTTLNLRDGQTVVVGGSAIDGVTYVVAVTASLMP